MKAHEAYVPRFNFYFARLKEVFRRGLRPWPEALDRKGLRWSAGVELACRLDVSDVTVIVIRAEPAMLVLTTTERAKSLHG